MLAINISGQDSTLALLNRKQNEHTKQEIITLIFMS